MKIHGCVYEPEKRRVTLKLLREMLELKHVRMTRAEYATFSQRARFFLVDHERSKQIVISLLGKSFILDKSQPHGHFSGTIVIADEELKRPGKASPLEFHAILPAKDPRVFKGQAMLVPNEGIMVISDIDDTIKVTEVGARKAMLRNTFLNAFKPVAGMPELYRAWAEKCGAQFCYVSASPWQLYTPLASFVGSNCFPAGAFHLKNFRWKDESFFSLFQSPDRYKPAVIEPLFAQFPDHRFVLVGDSGEMDPEIYGSLARRFPRQVRRVFIRNLASASSAADRYQLAFRGVPPEKWTLFRDPAEITTLLPNIPKAP